VVFDNPDEAGSPVDEIEADRLGRLTAGLRRAQADRARWAERRVLAILAGVLVPAGVLLVLVGWHGASRTPNVYEQIPYLISGAELGQTLALVGALCYFAHWLTTLVREHRTQGEAIVAAIVHLEEALVQLAGGVPSVTSEGLVATARGTLAHRPDCTVVAGKPGLRQVPPGTALGRCRLCLPA
jgi:multisubunit Na+/H+ antiporter MnhG subunit